MQDDRHRFQDKKSAHDKKHNLVTHDDRDDGKRRTQRGLFVLEAVSVILQVASYKLTGRRIFRMAPIHHHFELKGWPEPRVIVRFWIVTLVLVLIGLSTLKLR